MTDHGVTDDGFVRKTFDTLRQEAQTRLRASLERPDLDLIDEDSLIANIYLPALEQVADLWELAELVYNAIDPNRATRQSFEAVAALRGVPRKTPQVGTTDATIFNFSGAVAGTLARGAIRFYPESEPDNVWINSEAFSAASAGAYVVAAESELPGANKVLAQGATIEIADGPDALTSITVPEDATAGGDLEPEVTWRARANRVIQATQTRVGRAVEDVTNVIAARVVETPGFIQVIVNDSGTPAEDDAIAQAILDTKLEGVVALGSASGQAVDSEGELLTVNFDRVATVRLYVICEISSARGYGETAVRNALKASVPLDSGSTWIWSKASGAVTAVDGVDDLITLKIGTFNPPTQELNIPANTLEVLTLADGDISFA